MKIGLISDSPTRTTGFGKTTANIAAGLVKAGHEVVCFGFKATGQNFNADHYPYKIWSVGSKWQDVMKPYLEYEKFDALFFNMDIYNLKEVVDHCIDCGWDGPLSGYIVFDSYPVYPEYLDVLKRFSSIAVSTEASANYLKANGFFDVLISPPGVNPELFFPSPKREELRQIAGLSDYFVVGVFGRNRERKQQVRVLSALKTLIEKGEKDILVYLHCVPNGYWKLMEIAKELGVEDYLLFDAALYDETKGIRRTPLKLNTSERVAATQPCMPSDFGYVDRMNCCDMVVNVAHSGDFEHVIIESQACGVPLAHTHDQGVMSEAIGKGGILLEACDINIGKIGQRLFFVAPDTITEAVLQVKNDPTFRKQLIRRGYLNAMKYPWDKMRKMAGDVVAKLNQTELAEQAV